ncbi:MAG: PilZ domain-containing protein [Hyphomicrobiales bacterium]|nr:PilZ domain-containing protein [Hyphomicrobiales bacterium]
MPQELRRSPRRYIRQFAVACCGDGRPMQRCLLCNVSATGANIRMAGAAKTPDQFTLVLSPNGGVHRHCQVVWRSEHEVGVRFVEGRDKPSDKT